MVVYRNSALRAAQFFHYPEWPGGLYTTASISGSRSCGMVAQTWATLVSIGEDGFMSLTKGKIIVFK